MMKKMLSLLYVILLALLPMSALAAQGGYEFRLRGYVYGTLKYDASFLDPHLGPGYKYASTSLRLAAGSQVKVLTQARDASGNRWVLVEAEENRQAKRVYLLQQERGGQALITCDLSSVPTEAYELESSWQCMSMNAHGLRYGPGTEYASTGFTISYDTNAWVVLMNGGWALVECTDAYDDPPSQNPYFTRGWINFDYLVY